MVKQKKTKEESITSVKGSDQKSKPTPEQMRIAQILDRKVIDSSIKLKLKQIMDATQRTADEVYVALHDSDFDVNRAVDLLIEGDSLSNWCTMEKKKKNLQEIKEKKVEEARSVETEQNEDNSKMPRAPSFKGKEDLGRTGRGRGANGTSGRRPWRGNNEEFRGRGRGSRGRGNQPKAISGTMVFERSVAQETSANNRIPKTSIRNQWEKPLIRNPEDDWDTEEFTGSLSQTQIFTSSVKVESDIIPEDFQKAPNLPEGANDSWSPPQSQKPPLPSTLPPPPFIRPELTFNSSMIAHELPQTEGRTNMNSHTNTSPNIRSDYLCHLTKYAPKSLHIPSNDERKPPPPSKIPLSAVEMPPEMKSSLSFLDIQFGAIDLGPSASEDGSTETNSNALSQSGSASTILTPSSLPSSGSLTHLIGSSSSSITGNNLLSSNPISNATCVSALITPSSLLSVTGVSHLAPPVIPSAVPQTTAAALNNLVVPSTLPAVPSLIMGHNTLSAPSNHLMNHNLPSGSAGAQTQNRFIASSQSYNAAHLPYSFMTPPNSASTHQVEPPRAPHETNTSIPPPHLIQPSHLPSFKQTPPGVPKGAIVTNIPPGSLVGNQYLVGQGNVPYFPPHPIYYYEEVPSVINNQQRMPHHLSAGYEMNYPPSNPSSRDGVHYNV